jgi:putative MATE family efflux protein
MIDETKKFRRRAILTIAVPIIIQNIVQQVMLLTDRAFLGNLNPRYLAVIGNVMFPYNALTYFFFSMATGLVILIAQSIGAKDYDKAERLGESSFFYSTLISTALFALWFFGAETIFRVFKVEGVILRDAVTFVRILCFTLIFSGIDVTAGFILQGAGVTRPIMVFGILKGVLNVAFDWVLIFGNLGFPKLGLEGAAIATMAATIVGSVGILITVLMVKQLPFRLSKRAIIKPEWRLYRETLRVGLPTGIESLLWYVGQLVLVRLLNQVDDMAIGIYSLVNGIQGLVFIMYIGFAKASLTMVGQRFGEGDTVEARNTGMHCIKLTFLVTLVSLVIFEAVPRFLTGIFTTDPETLNRAIPLLRLAGFFIQVQALNVLTGHAIRATGDTKWMLYSQIFGTFFVVGVSLLMICYFKLGLIGMYLTMICDEASRGVVNFFRFYWGKNPFPQWFAWTMSGESKTE